VDYFVHYVTFIAHLLSYFVSLFCIGGTWQKHMMAPRDYGKTKL